MNDLISRKALIAEYDRVHVGPPGGARKLMEDAPSVEAIPVQWIVDNYIKNHETGERKMAMVSMIFKWREEKKDETGGR